MKKDEKTPYFQALHWAMLLVNSLNVLLLKQVRIRRQMLTYRLKDI